MDAASGKLALTSEEKPVITRMPTPRRGNEPAMKDDDLGHHVAAELSWDPQVGSEAIEVSAASGVVTLRGSVASLRLKRAGSRTAARVRGVTRVADELRVQIPDKDRRDDEDLCGDVLEALMLDVSVPMTVDAQARDGFVTLTGTAQWHHQREAAELRAANVPGVTITLTQTPQCP
jgi:osmotically-inducible protein OsmY